MCCALSVRKENSIKAQTQFTLLEIWKQHGVHTGSAGVNISECLDISLRTNTEKDIIMKTFNEHHGVRRDY